MPRDQNNRPIGFMLFNGGAAGSVNLHIRPEELTKTEVGRVTVHQTLGGAWSDDFGKGIGEINISGHTGWGQGGLPDGFERFQALARLWEEFRRRRVQSVDPDAVEMLFEDQLNDYAVKVDPVQFVLRRNKRSPLLHHYQIRMLVLDDAGVPGRLRPDPITQALGNAAERHETSADALFANIERQSALRYDLTDAGLGSNGRPLRGLVDLSNDVLMKVATAAKRGTDAFDDALLPVLQFSADLERAARNAYEVLVTPILAAEDVKHSLSRVASNFNDAYCNIVNGINALRGAPDFSTIFGASTCSTTLGAGGRSPYHDANTFAQFISAASDEVTVNDGARNAIDVLARDPLSIPGNVNAIIGEIRNLNAGVRVR